MAFSSLLSGADCSVSSNPLHSALKTFANDSSLQRDAASASQIAGPSRFRSPGPQNAAQDADRFFEPHSRIAPFEMQELRASLSGETQSAFAPPPNGQNWARDFAHSNSGTSTPAVRAQQQQPAANYAPIQRSNYTPQMMYSQQYQPQFMSQQPMAASFESKGKQKDDRFIELSAAEWESEFAKFAEVDNQQQEQLDDAQEEEDQDDLLKEVDKKWRSMTHGLEEQAAADREMAAWEAQYGAQLDPDYRDATEPFTAQDLIDRALDQEWTSLTPEQENAYRESSDPFAEGKRLLAEGAPFNLVEQAFEEAVKRDPSRAEAWVALGETLAADEKELLAIKALEKAVVAEGRGNEAGWLSLAISFINEGQDSRAMTVLEEWLRKTYPALIPPQGFQPSAEPVLDKDGMAVSNPWQVQQQMIAVFLEAARAGPAARLASTRSPEMEDGQGAVDADVQVGLGVLFYANHDYDYAKDCFEAALSVRPKDYILWNRLGATLANGGNPEEAISAYRTALSLRPNFTRSLYNLAVSCLNINCAHEAAEHILAALELQGSSGKGEESGPLWSTLRRAFFHLDRPDLASQAVMGGDVAQFRREGFSF